MRPGKKLPGQATEEACEDLPCSISAVHTAEANFFEITHRFLRETCYLLPGSRV